MIRNCTGATVLENHAWWAPVTHILGIILIPITALFMIFGQTVAYVFQYVEIVKKKNAVGFSLYVCLALLVANVFKIFFWVGKRFDWVVPVASFVMIVGMILLLEVSVRTNRRNLMRRSQRASIWRGNFFDSFWKWHDVSSYLVVFFFITGLMSILTGFLVQFDIYVTVIGFVPMFLEAGLGLPQMYRNYVRKSTTGMSIKMVLSWLVGDCYCTFFYAYRKAPAQLYICSSLQIVTDLFILGQVYYYNRETL